MSTDGLLAGRYRLGSSLGEGGMGIVWRAWDELLGREVAVKEVRLPAHMPADARQELCERTMREARAAGGLAHPSIITVHDVLVADGRPWIVMDLVSGPSLERLLAGGERLSPRRAAVIGLQLLEALALAHERGVLHRDVKPANVLLAEGDRAILTDFGIAVRSGEAALTSADAVVGSPGYMAPERVRNDRAAGPPSDLWSLAATLYAAVEGRGPFHRDNRLATLGAVLTHPAPPPAHAGPLGPVLLAVLAKDPGRRPDTEAFRQALHAVAHPDQAGVTPGVTPDGTGSDTARKRARKHARGPGGEHGRGGAAYPPGQASPSLPGGTAPGPRTGRDGVDTVDHPFQPAFPAARRRRPLVAAAVAGAVAASAVTAAALLMTNATTTTGPPGTTTSGPTTGPTTGPVTATSVSTPPPSPTAAAVPDPCTLLTEAQAAALTGGAPSPEGTTTCSWRGRTQLDIKINGYPEEKTAEETLALHRAAAVSEAGVGKGELTTVTVSAVRRVPGLGDEAFAQDEGTVSDFGDSAATTVWLRSGRTLLTVTHTAREQPKVSDDVRDGALRAARQALANLP
ncbi:serine/threonine-protein kinase [Nonomuraea sp. KM88]|uniref:serine/threonine-protein kinase n=1 Tax=Nonomuraea sp. KM88 TaxID=3457427 RepID=UPI003FCCCF26